MVKEYPTVNMLMEYENGTMSEDEAIQLFQHLIDTGLAWQLQGRYGRTAHRLIEDGYCILKTN
jgi:hypothetical protein